MLMDRAQLETACANAKQEYETSRQAMRTAHCKYKQLQADLCRDNRRITVQNRKRKVAEFASSLPVQMMVLSKIQIDIDTHTNVEKQYLDGSISGESQNELCEVRVKLADAKRQLAKAKDAFVDMCIHEFDKSARLCEQRCIWCAATPSMEIISTCACESCIKSNK